MKLLNRADGCNGHYCIGREVSNAASEMFALPCWEFWNEEERKWCSAGTVYTKKQAMVKMKKLKGELK